MINIGVAETELKKIKHTHFDWFDITKASLLYHSAWWILIIREFCPSVQFGYECSGGNPKSTKQRAMDYLPIYPFYVRFEQFWKNGLWKLLLLYQDQISNLSLLSYCVNGRGRLQENYFMWPSKKIEFTYPISYYPILISRFFYGVPLSGPSTQFIFFFWFFTKTITTVNMRSHHEGDHSPLIFLDFPLIKLPGQFCLNRSTIRKQTFKWEIDSYVYTWDSVTAHPYTQ